MGVDVGCPDLILRQKRKNITHLFFLELKKKDGKLMQSQIDWNKDFDENYAADNCTRDVAYGYDEAIEKINAWIKRTPARKQFVSTKE